MTKNELIKALNEEAEKYLDEQTYGFEWIVPALEAAAEALKGKAAVEEQIRVAGVFLHAYSPYTQQA